MLSSIVAAQTTAPASAPVTVPGAPPPAVPGLDSRQLIILFDGKTLDGWEYNPAAWSVVEGGVMRGTGKGGDIFTKADYGSFRLILTSRVASPPGDDGHNHLGVLFWGDRPTDGKFGTNNAIQVQPPHGAMWDYHKGKGNIRVERDPPTSNRRYQDWHVTEILANIETGEVRVATDGQEISKYKYPDVSILKKGPIGMQIHAATGVFDHKNILIEPEPKEPTKFLTVK